MLEVIRNLCALKGITQKELAESVGIGKKSLLNWDKHSPLISNVVLVADYFGVSVDYLLGRTQDQYNYLHTLLNELNEEGKEKVLEYAEMLAESGKYKKLNSVEMVEEA